MSLQKKTFVIIVTILLLTLAFLYIVSTRLSNTLLSGLTSVESENALSNLKQVANVLSNDLNNLDLKLIDWSSWSETYQFMIDQNKKYLKNNISDGSFDVNGQLKINAMIFIDTQGKIVLARGYDLVNQKQILVPQSLLDQITKDSIILQSHSDKNSALNGFINLPEEPVLIAARPILTNDSKGPSHGTLIFVRFLDANVLSNLKKTVGFTVNINQISNANVPQELLNSSGAILTLSNPPNAIKVISSNMIAGYTLIPDIYGKKGFVLEIELNRNIYQQSQVIIRYLIFSILGAGVLFGLIILIILNRLVLSRLSQFNFDLKEITSSGDLAKRLSVAGEDEIANLGKVINMMLAKLDESETHLKNENITIEQKVEDRTGQLEQKTNELIKANEKVASSYLEIDQERTRLLAAISSLPLGAVMTDSQNEVFAINLKARYLLNLQNETVSFNDLITAFGTNFDFKTNYEKVQKEKQPVILPEIAYQQKFLRVFLTPIDIKRLQKEFIGIIVLIEDITSEKLLERSKNEFLAVASHELRTPLTVIQLNASVLLDEFAPKINPEGQKMVAQIKDSSVQLIELANEFLEASTLEQQKVVFHNANFDLVALGNEVVEQFKKEAEIKKIYLKLETNEKDLEIFADKNRVRQIYTNLIANAMKFTATGGVTVKIEKTKDEAKVSFIDTGRGIGEKEKQLLFKKFQQAGSDIYEHKALGGTGMGLYISKLLCEGMNGKISLEYSEIDRGSTFVFTLPLAHKEVTA